MDGRKDQIYLLESVQIDKRNSEDFVRHLDMVLGTLLLTRLKKTDLSFNNRWRGVLQKHRQNDKKTL